MKRNIDENPRNYHCKKSERFLLAILFFVLVGTYAQGDVIISVDVADPTAVVFDSTSAASQVDHVDFSIQGITLLNFFSGNATTTNVFLDSGSIDVFNSAGATTQGNLEAIFIGFFGGGYTPNDVNIYDGFAPFFPTHFFDTEPALDGTAVHNLSGFTGLPNPGTTGDVVAGQPNFGVVIGQWEVPAEQMNVPEPTSALSFGVLAVFFGCVVCWRRYSLFLSTLPDIA